MHKVGKRRRSGIAMTERMYQALVPIRWVMLLMIGLSFAGATTFRRRSPLRPVAAGLSVSLYASGFLMVFVLIASFFKRRFFCTICPLGYLMGLAHRVQPFRIKEGLHRMHRVRRLLRGLPDGHQAALYRARADRRYGRLVHHVRRMRAVLSRGLRPFAHLLGERTSKSPSARGRPRSNT